jgi:hypothetical protein
MQVNVSEPCLLSLLASDGNPNLYGRAHIYNSVGTLTYSVDLSHVGEGLYCGTHTFSLEGYYSAVYQFFLDAPRTVEADYEHQGETLDVNSLKGNLLRLLGLAHENSVVDLQVYDVEGNLKGARVRCYDNPTNAATAIALSPLPSPAGLRFTYDVSATYQAGALARYSILRTL